jgi:hypothetical protein
VNSTTSITYPTLLVIAVPTDPVTNA